MSREKEEEDGKKKNGGVGEGSAALWLGTQSSLSLQHTGVISFRASHYILCLSFFFSLLRPHLLALLL